MSHIRLKARNALAAGTTLVALLLGAGAGFAAEVFPEPAALPVQTNLPDPLVRLDGHHIDFPKEWTKQRRPELKELFQHYMYGALPPSPSYFHATVLGTHNDFLEGKATLKLVQLETGKGTAPRIDLMLVLPSQSQGPVPVFVALNFCGNQALTSDPRVPLAHGWMPSSCKGCNDNAATEASRGSQAADWPLADIVRRGYGLAAFYHGDVDSDRQEVSDGIYAFLAKGDPARNNPTNRGTIAAWAWGVQRCVDYLVSDPAVDPHRIAVVGHSRNGKAALLAAAFDERIAIAFPHQAGCGGSAPSRGTVGESVRQINDRFPHWFNAEFKKFNDLPQRLPFDQNCLVALCAPRPVLFTAATQDQWSNPAGQFEVLKAADSVYRFLGVEGLGAKQMPPVGELVASRLGYFIREGKHSMTPADWTVFMDYADRQWKR